MLHGKSHALRETNLLRIFQLLLKLTVLTIGESGQKTGLQEKVLLIRDEYAQIMLQGEPATDFCSDLSQRSTFTKL